MDQKSFFYPESKYGNYTNIDGTILFYLRVNSLLSKSSHLLDVGCGRGECGDDLIEIRRNLRIFKGKVSKVIGIDVNISGIENPFLDEFRQIIGLNWPIDNGSIDIIICDWVIEHVNDTEKFFSEAKRVLKKDGIIFIRTPNKWNYVTILSKLIPNRFHSKILSVAQPRKKEMDVFPTYYQCNTIPSIKNRLSNAGLKDIVVFCYDAEPAYLSFSKFAYRMGVLHQKISPQIFKSTLIAIAKNL